MSKKVFRAGIVGCGRIAGVHAAAYHRHPRFALEAAVERDSARRKLFQSAWKVPAVYASLDEMLRRERLDVISICSPDECHFSQAEQIMDSGRCPKVLFIEKPVCRSRKEFKELKNLSVQSGCAVVVNHTRRFDPAHMKLAKMIREGKLGRLIEGRFDYYGGWLCNGVHLVDTVRMLFAQEPQLKDVATGASGRGNDACLNAKLKIAGAFIDVFSFDEKYYQLFEADFRFTKGRALLRDFGSEIIIEELQVNRIGERVLVAAKTSPLKGLDSPLYRAAGLIADFLDGKAEFDDYGVTLNAAEGTMHALWEGLKRVRH